MHERGVWNFSGAAISMEMASSRYGAASAGAAVRKAARASSGGIEGFLFSRSSTLPSGSACIHSLAIRVHSNAWFKIQAVSQTTPPGNSATRNKSEESYAF